jgi:LPXTG-site transpeptidase (sortase) family protein
LKSFSFRLMLIGCALLLLAAVRMVSTSSQPLSAPTWEDADQEGVVQAMAAHPQVAPSVVPVSTEPANPPAAAGTTQAALPFPTIREQVNTAEGEKIQTGGLGERLISSNMQGVPVRIVIPSIGLDAEVVIAKTRKILIQGDVFEQWVPPRERVAGWSATSAKLGEVGNTVISGHHNEYGEVFARLVDVNAGDIILVYTRDWTYSYRVSNRMILPEADVPTAQRIENARWIGRSTDERLTLVTCWPADSNTHRLILVASPN